MTFLHPGYLLGLVGLALPVLIHLFGRRRPRRVPFPSLRLVKRTTERQRALLRLRHLLVLLLRMLAVLFLVLALAGPRARSGWLARALGSSSRAVVVLLDDSASMGAVAHDRAAFSRASSAARDILGALGSGEPTALARTSQRQPPTLGSPAAAAAAIPTASSAVGGPIAPALERALEALLTTDASDRRVYVLTDLQATAWRDLAIRKSLALPGASVIAVDCGADGLENRAVAQVFPAVQPVVAGRPVRLKVRLERFGGEKPFRARVTLHLADEPAEAKSAVVEPKGSAYVEFARRLPKPGAYAGEVELPPDCLPADDVGRFVLLVGEPVRVLCLGVSEEFRYVQAALRPPGVQASPVAPVVQTPSAASAQVLRGVEVLAVGRLTAPSQSLLDALAQRGDLSVLLFLGDGIDLDYYNQKLLPALFGQGAVRLGGVISASPGQYYVVAETETGRGPLRPFAEPQAGDLSRAHYTRCRDIEVGAGARVLARFDNGIPALLESGAGRRAMLINSTADDAWSDAPFQMAFVPLMHHLVYYLAQPQRPEPPSAVVGQTLVSAKGLYVAPDGRQVSAEELAASGPPVGGVYRDAQGKPAFAANVDPRESDLRRASPAAVRRALRGFSAEVIAVQDLRQALARAAAPVADLSSFFFLLAFACLAGELWLSARGRTAPASQP